MNFIELASDKEYKISLNIKLIESVELVAGLVEIHTLNKEKFFRTRESYSEVMAKMHKAKRLEIASRLADVSLRWYCEQDGIRVVDREKLVVKSLELAEELIKQNDKME